MSGNFEHTNIPLSTTETLGVGFPKRNQLFIGKGPGKFKVLRAISDYKDDYPGLGPWRIVQRRARGNHEF